MSRPQGMPKTGGRVRGTPNKRSADLFGKLGRMGCDPMEGLARIALDPDTDVALKVRCFAELAQYVYPKRRAIDVAADPHDGVKVTVDFIESKANWEGSVAPPNLSCADKQCDE